MPGSVGSEPLQHLLVRYRHLLKHVAFGRVAEATVERHYVLPGMEGHELKSALAGESLGLFDHFAPNPPALPIGGDGHLAHFDLAGFKRHED